MIENLIIDGQILQTDAWHRGMGKYLLQVLKQLSEYTKNDLSPRVYLLFNGSIPTDRKRYEVIKYLCPNIVHLNYRLPVPLTIAGEKNAGEYKRQLGNAIEREFHGERVTFLISALFFFDFFAEFPNNCRKALLFYDLTPLLFWKDLGGYFPPDLYMRRFRRVYEAETIFAISDTTRKDLLNTFGLPPSNVVTINGGYTKIAEQVKELKNIKRLKGYILYPTGDLPHKNNEIAIRGYEQYRHAHTTPLPLLVTSSFSENSMNRLSELSEGIMFTGNVADEELEWLYENASAVLFASKYEGLGLPILDAVASQKPIIISRISVFQEMSKQAFYYFDLDDTNSVAEAIDSAVRRTDFDKKKREYPKIVSKYTWRNTTLGFIDGINRAAESNDDQSAVHSVAAEQRPRIAVASLHPGIPDQVGNKAEAMLFALAKAYDVDFYFDNNGFHYREMQRPTFLEYMDRNCYDITKLDIDSYKQYDLVVYLLDEQSIPSRLAQRASIFPGVACIIKIQGSEGVSRRMFEEIIVGNQFGVLELGNGSFNEYMDLVEWLGERIKCKFKKTPAKLRDEIIRNGKLKKNIMRRLMES